MLKENLSFVGICVLVFAALLGLAYLFERTVCRDLQRRSRSRNISTHDQRDFEYAQAHDIEMIQVIDGADVSEHAFEKQAATSRSTSATCFS